MALWAVDSKEVALRKLIIAWMLLCAILISGCHHKPDPIFHDTQGHAFQFSSLRGKWIFINYWATWCHSCKHEVAALNQFYHQYKTKKVQVLGVNFDRLKGKALKEAIKTLGIQFPVLLERPNKVLGLEAVGIVPTTFVINPKGELVRTLLGPQTVASLRQVLSHSAALR